MEREIATGRKIMLMEGDITRVAADAIVNAANRATGEARQGHTEPVTTLWPSASRVTASRFENPPQASKHGLFARYE